MRLIDADALNKCIEDLPDCYNGFSDTYDKACIIGVIDEQPTIEAEPLKTGKWLYNGSDGYNMLGEEFRWKKCSLCGYSYSTTLSKSHNYCPNCGARMSEGSEE